MEARDHARICAAGRVAWARAGAVKLDVVWTWWEGTRREGGSTDFHVGNWGMWGDGRVGRRGWRRKGCEELERIISK